MADEPKFNFPVIRNGKQSIVADPGVTTAQRPPVFKFPTVEEQVKSYGDQGPGRAMLRGLTMGLSDRAEALISPGKYEDNLKRIQSNKETYASDHPYSSLGNELLGGLASGGAISGVLKKLGSAVLPTVAKFANTVGLAPAATRVGQVAAEGGIFGEVGSQAQKPYGEVGTDPGVGVLYGAGAGVGLTALGKTLGMVKNAGAKVGQRGAMAAGLVHPEDFASAKYIQSLRAQGMEPEEITAALKYLRGDDLAQHGPVGGGNTLPNMQTPVRVADVVPKSTMGVFAKGIKSSDSAVSEVSDTLGNRSAEQGTRLQNHVGSTLSDDMASTATEDALQDQRAAAADPHYKAAYAVGSPKDAAVDAWINDRPVNAQIFQELKKNLDTNASQGGGAGKPMKAEVTVDPQTGQFVWKHRPSIEDLDTLKKHIDAKRNDMWNPAKGQFNLPRTPGMADATQLGNQRDDLVELINKLTPDGKGGSHYENARKAFADDSALIDAHRTGQDVMRQRPEDVQKQFDSFQGKPELEGQYRAGIASVVKDLIDKSDTGGGAAIVRKLYGSPGMTQKLQYVMANEPSNAQFSRSMASEKAMVDTQRSLVPNNTNTDLLGDAEGFSLPLAAVNALSGRYGAAASQVGRFGTGSIAGMAPEAGDELASIAMMNPEQHADWTAAWRAKQQTPGAKAARGMGALTEYALKGIPAIGSNVTGMLPKQGSNGVDQDNY
jgi:hypothetical protein